MTLDLKKDDVVEVIRGKDRGRRGKVLSLVHEAEGTFLTVEKVGLIKRHQRATPQSPGGIIEKLGLIARAKVMIVCPKCDKPTRVKRSLQDGTKVRQCKHCDAIIA